MLEISITKLLEIMALVVAVTGVSIGGLAFWVARKFVQAEVNDVVSKDIQLLHDRISKMKDEYVTCKFCMTQHDNINNRLKEVSDGVKSIIDMLLTVKIGGSQN